MPKPRKTETKQEFINRCIPFVLKEGTTKKQDQAIAICHNLWRNKNKIKK